MKKIYFIVFALSFSACSEKRECSFDNLDNAVDCACQLINEKEAANSDKEIIKKLKSQSDALNESFEKALADSIFTEKEFINQLKSTCENF